MTNTIREHDPQVNRLRGDVRLCKAVVHELVSFQLSSKMQGMRNSPEKIRMMMRAVKEGIEDLDEGEEKKVAVRNLKVIEGADKEGKFRERLFKPSEDYEELKEKVNASEGIEGFLGDF